MSYWPSLVLVALGALLLGVLIVRIVMVLRRFSRTATMVMTSTKERTGLLRARAAGVLVAVGRWRRSPTTAQAAYPEEERESG